MKLLLLQTKITLVRTFCVLPSLSLPGIESRLYIPKPFAALIQLKYPPRRRRDSLGRLYFKLKIARPSIVRATEHAPVDTARSNASCFYKSNMVAQELKLCKMETLA